MKTMTCKQLGGACNQKFNAGTFDEMAALSKKHAMDMVRQGDEGHLKAMNEMQEFMQSPDTMNQWMETKRKEFEALPDNE